MGDEAVGQNAGAGTPPPPAAEGGAAGGTPPPTMEQLMQRIQQQEQRLAAQDAIIQAAALEADQRARSAPPPSPGAEDDDVDPAVKKLTQTQDAYMRRLATLQERLDYQEFASRVREANMSSDTVAASEKVFQAWRKAGITFGGEPPSRLDALRYHLGMEAEAGAMKTMSARAAAEAARRSGNEDATLERGGRSGRAGSMDPEKMSRKERLDKYYTAVLDEEGF